MLAGLACLAAPTPAFSRSEPLPTISISLPQGPLSRAVAAIASRSDASIGTDHPEWLRRPLGPLTLSGRADEVLAQVLERAGLEAMRTGPRSWRIVKHSPPRRLRPAPSRVTLESQPPEDIVVTGSKVGLRLRDFPGTVDVIGAERLNQAPLGKGTLSLSALHATLSSTRLGPGRNKLFLRSIADSSFNGNSPALVGQYWGDQRLTYASPDPDLRLHDVEQVEILEGPQGTLYGAGSLGGILRIVPRRPDPRVLTGSGWGGISATAGGGMGHDSGVVANIPLIAADDDTEKANAALRIVAYDELDAGFIDDSRRQRSDVNRSTVRGARIALSLAPTQQWSIELSAFGQDIRNADAQYVQADPQSGRTSLSRASAVAQPSFHIYRALSLLVKHDLGAVSLQSTTGYIRQHFGQVFDATQPGEEPTSFRQDDRVTLLSNETRLSGTTSANATWVMGIAALQSRNREVRMLDLPSGLADLGHVRSRVTEATIFGEFGVPISPSWTITAGGRTSRVTVGGRARGPLAKPIGSGSPVSRHDNAQWLATPSISIGWRPDDRISLYARFAGGYRPGGLTIGAVLERFNADRIRTSEVGLRYACHCTSRLRFDGSLSTSRWKDIQADLLDGLGLPRVSNIGNGVVRTATATISITPAPSFELNASGFASKGALRGTQGSIDIISRSALPNVARYGLTGSIRKQWLLPGDKALTLDLRGQAVGPSILGIGPQLSHAQGNYRTLAASTSLDAGRWTLSLTAENLLDGRGNVFALGTPFTIATGHQQTPLQPRTMRLGFELRY